MVWVEFIDSFCEEFRKDLRHLICTEVDPLPAALNSYGKMFERLKSNDDVAITKVWLPEVLTFGWKESFKMSCYA